MLFTSYIHDSILNLQALSFSNKYIREAIMWIEEIGKKSDYYTHFNRCCDVDQVSLYSLLNMAC